MLLLAGLLLAPGLASAQASVQFSVNLPVVLPPMVVVQPGVRVVPDAEEEVFFVDNYYWVRHDGGWYRSRNHRGGWVYVAPRAVPAGIVGIPPGRYRHYRPEPRPVPVRAAPAPYARPAPAPVRYERDDDRGHHDHDRGEHGNGKKKGHHKHDD